jgi:hypothetical protein
VYEHPEAVVDGDPATECTLTRNPGLAGDIDVRFVIDLGAPCVIQSLHVANGQSKPFRWVKEIEVGSDGKHYRKLLGRSINLPMWRRGDSMEIAVPPAVGRYVAVSFGGVREGAVSEIEVLGRPNKPERHLLCWSGSIQNDYLDKLDYLEKELGATDLWLDSVETAFPQTVTNGGFQTWIDSGAFDRFKERGLRYWLCEHEAFCFMVNRPEDLHDDLRWQTTLRETRRVYAKARELGFRGVVWDAEDYDGVAAEAKERYKDKADHVAAWTFTDEFGYSGAYYQRGRQVGKAMREVWPDGVLLQLYEARMYDGIPGCRDGNYWWLKGIHEEGVEIWIATEKTYGAGKGEMHTPENLPHLTRWFVRLPKFVPAVFEEYPFAARVLPGFHPWNSRTKAPNYLPKYLDEQLTLAEGLVQGYWIYCEGNPGAGDPRDVLDREVCAKYGVEPEEYLEVFQKHATSRTYQGR